MNVICIIYIYTCECEYMHSILNYTNTKNTCKIKYIYLHFWKHLNVQY